jgi:toxin ParE1/3/4
MARLLQTDEAEQSIVAIGCYIAEQSQSLETAWRVLDRIEEKCRLYAAQPLLGEARPDLGVDVRCFPVDSFVVIYRPLPDGILLLLVVHGSRDIPAVFRSVYPSQL